MKLKIFVLFTSIALLGMTSNVFADCGSCEGDETAHSGKEHCSTTDHLDTALESYLSIQESLAADDLDSAKATAATWLKDVGEESHACDIIESIANAENLENAREAFLSFSDLMIEGAQEGKLNHEQSLYLAHCPMAFHNKGGSWLQTDETVNNPYFGAKMLHCGTIKAL